MKQWKLPLATVFGAMVGVMTPMHLAQAKTNTRVNPPPKMMQEKNQASKTVSKPQGVWIDVRTPQEMEQGHIAGAMNIPLDQLLTRIHAAVPNKATPIHLYCRSGSRSDMALRMLRSVGYTNAVNQGGYQDLLDQGIR